MAVILKVFFIFYVALVDIFILSVLMMKIWDLFALVKRRFRNVAE